MYRPLWVRFWVLFLITVSVGPLLLTPVLTPVLAQSDERETAGETIILLPSIRGEFVSAPSPLPQEDGPVFGLLGTLLAAQGQPFSTYLVLADPNDKGVGVVLDWWVKRRIWRRVLQRCAISSPRVRPLIVK